MAWLTRSIKYEVIGMSGTWSGGGGTRSVTIRKMKDETVPPGSRFISSTFEVSSIRNTGVQASFVGYYDSDRLLYTQVATSSDLVPQRNENSVTAPSAQSTIMYGVTESGIIMNVYLSPTSASGVYIPNDAKVYITVRYEADIKDAFDVYWFDGDKWLPSLVYIYDGTMWKECEVYCFDGSKWCKCKTIT